MTGPEHFREAERLARKAVDYEGLPSNHHIQAGQVAQVHATLALAAATATGVCDHPHQVWTEWRAAVVQPATDAED